VAAADDPLDPTDDPSTTPADQLPAGVGSSSDTPWAPEGGAWSDLDHARRVVSEATRILVLTGAGISTDSGIPDFRGPQGVWTRDPEAERLSSIDSFVADPAVRRRAWQVRLASPVDAAEPNAGHLALVELERRGVLELLVTQNIDGLHVRAGHTPALVVEIHGTTREAVCLRCAARWPMDEILARVRAGDDDPRCTEPAGIGPAGTNTADIGTAGTDTEWTSPARASAAGIGTAGTSTERASTAGANAERACGGLVKAATISFGQPLVAADLERAERAALRCDLILAVGSTLSVHPAASLVPTAERAGAAVVIVNGGPTAMDGLADAVVHGPIGQVLPVLVGHRSSHRSSDNIPSVGDHDRSRRR
jgi:NAD-dependent deacetylase